MPIDQEYARREAETRELWSMKMSRRTKYLATLAARATGQTLSSYVEQSLNYSFAAVEIVDAQLSGTGTSQSLEELAQDLYSPDEAERFLALTQIAMHLLSNAEHRLLTVLIHSDHFAPRRVLLEDVVKAEWQDLRRMRDNGADQSLLAERKRSRADLSFGLLGDKERTEYYKRDPEGFAIDAARYLKTYEESKK